MSRTRHPAYRTKRSAGAPGLLGRTSSLAGRPVVWLIRGYQLVLSPMHPAVCRFYPSCSAYAVTAIERFGLVRGGLLAARRLLRCHPWNPGGVDHVPSGAGKRRGDVSAQVASAGGLSTIDPPDRAHSTAHHDPPHAVRTGGATGGTPWAT